MNNVGGDLDTITWVKMKIRVSYDAYMSQITYFGAIPVKFEKFCQRLKETCKTFKNMISILQAWVFEFEIPSLQETSLNDKFYSIPKPFFSILKKTVK